MFPIKRERPTRPPWPTIAVLLALVVVWEVFKWQTERRVAGGARGTVEHLTLPRVSPDAQGRAGDLVLRAPGGASLTIAASPDIAGHRPLLGAIVDVAMGPGDSSDPLIWLRTTTRDGAGAVAELAERPPQPFICADGSTGVRGYGALGVGLTAETCVEGASGFTLSTTVSSLSDRSSIVDELNVGSLPVLTLHGPLTGGEVDTPFVAFGGKGIAALLEAPRMHAGRPVSGSGAEAFPSPVIVRYGGDKTVSRKLRLLRGDALDAIALLSVATRVVEVSFGPERGGEVSIRDEAGAEISSGVVARGATRTLRLPAGLGVFAVLRDDRGLVTDPRVLLPPPGGRASVRATARVPATVMLAYRDEAGSPIPVHVLIKGQGETADPRPVDVEGRVVVAGRSLYLLDGRTRVSVAPGAYRITASHGTAYSLSVTDVTVSAEAPATIEAALRRVVDTSGWLAADLHLHAAPSPDSDVALAERVQSLACEGIELGVATDHNRVTDYAPQVHALGLDGVLATAAGVEVSSGGERWGQFNAYPLLPPSGAPEEGVPVYFGRRPAEMFASARELGARIVQVNHARVAAGTGYFELARLDPKTGHASGEFSSDFDALEAYSGMWIEKRDEIRQGAVDLVALARRGKRVAAVGGSDAHTLLHEEVGYPRTYVHTSAAPVGTRFERLVTALLGGRDTMVTSGPFVELAVEGHGVGSVVVPPAGGSVHVRVRVSAPAWVPVEHVEIWRDDTVVRRFTVEGPPKDGVRFEGEIDVPVGGSDAVVLAWAEAEQALPDVVACEHPLAIGFTGLVYVDGNRDGQITVPPAP